MSPIFRQSPTIYWFFKTSLLKVRSFIEPQRFSPLIPSYLLKVTKLLGKISQLEFLVVTEKNIFGYKLFLSLNISDFNLFDVKIATPPEKSHPLFPSNPLSKLTSCQAPHFWKFGGSTSFLKRGGGGCPLGWFEIRKKPISGREWDSLWEVKI